MRKSSMPRTVLVVDDDSDHRELIRHIVLSLGYSVVHASTGAEALSRMTDANAPAIDIIVLDLVMPDIDGMAVLDRMRKARISIPVVVQTTSNAIDCVGSVIRAGASDFILKPAGRERLAVVLENSLQRKRLETELESVRRSPAFFKDIEDFLDINPSLKDMRSKYVKAACSDYPILIDGPPGVGKAMFAVAMHGSSRYHDKRFLSIDCKNAGLTSGISAIIEYFQCRFDADGGTLFFRNVDCLSNSDQILLKGVLSKQGSLLGPCIDKKFRIISSVTGSAVNAVRAGILREDLFYKLSIYPITITPFVNRPQDMEPSAIRIVARLSAAMGQCVQSIDSDAIELLKSRPWPGNARELEQAIFRAINLCDGDRLGVNNFSILLNVTNGLISNHRSASKLDQIDCRPISHRDNSLSAQYGMLDLLGRSGELRTLEELEAMTLKFAFERYGGCIMETARRLGIGRSTLYRKLRLSGLVRSPEHTLNSIGQAA